MKKQRNIIFRKMSFKSFPNFLFGSVKLLNKNLKDDKKVKTISLWAFILLAGPACLIYTIQE